MKSFPMRALLAVTALLMLSIPDLAQAKIEFPAHFHSGVPGSTVEAEGKTGVIGSDGRATLCCFEFGGESRGKEYYYHIAKPGYVSRFDYFHFVTQNAVGINAGLISECAYSKKSHYNYDSSVIDQLPDDSDGDGLSTNCDCDDNDASNTVNKNTSPCPEKIQGTDLSDPINENIDAIRKCSDTDIGNDPYFRGDVYAGAGKVAPTSDTCEGSGVKQFDCVDGYVKSVGVTSCPYGCAGGACKSRPIEAPPPPKPEPEELSCHEYYKCAAQVMLSSPDCALPQTEQEIRSCYWKYWSLLGSCNQKHHPCAADMYSYFGAVPPSTPPSQPKPPPAPSPVPTPYPNTATSKPPTPSPERQEARAEERSRREQLQREQRVMRGVCDDATLLFGEASRALCEEFLQAEDQGSPPPPSDDCLILELAGVSNETCQAFERLSEERDTACKWYAQLSQQIVREKDQCLRQCDTLSAGNSCKNCFAWYAENIGTLNREATKNSVPIVCQAQYAPPSVPRESTDEYQILGVTVEGGGPGPQIYRRSGSNYYAEPASERWMGQYDIIEARNSRTVLHMQNGLDITIDPGSRIMVGQLVRNAQMSVTQQAGRVQYTSEPSDPVQTLIGTIDAWIASDHTDFAVHKGPDGTTVKVYEGQVTVSDFTGNYPTKVRQGEVFMIKRGRIPGKPTVFDDSLHGAAMERGGSGGSWAAVLLGIVLISVIAALPYIRKHVKFQ